MSMRWFGLGGRGVEVVGGAHEERAGADGGDAVRRAASRPTAGCGASIRCHQVWRTSIDGGWHGCVGRGHPDRVGQGAGGRAPSCDCGLCAVLSPAPALYSRRRGRMDDRAGRGGRSATLGRVTRPGRPVREAGSSRSKDPREPARRPRPTALADASRRGEAWTSTSPASPAGPGSASGSARSSWRGPTPAAADRPADRRAPLQRRPPPARDRGHPAGARRGPDGRLCARFADSTLAYQGYGAGRPARDAPGARGRRDRRPAART